MNEPRCGTEANGIRLQWGTARANSHGGLSQEGREQPASGEAEAWTCLGKQVEMTWVYVVVVCENFFFCGTIALRRVGVLEMSIPIYM